VGGSSRKRSPLARGQRDSHCSPPIAATAGGPKCGYALQVQVRGKVAGALGVISALLRVDPGRQQGDGRVPETQAMRGPRGPAAAVRSVWPVGTDTAGEKKGMVAHKRGPSPRRW